MNEFEADIPLISIVTVVYNGEKYLDKTLESIRQQSFQNFEVIIVDGGSIDGTLKVVERFGSLVTKVMSERDNGIYDAMNKGVELASGKWVIFMNAGDEFVIDSLDHVKEMLLDTSVDILYGDVFIDKDGVLNLDKAKDIESIGYSLPFCHQSCFVRVEHLKKLKFSLNYLICSDYDFFLRAANLGLNFKYANNTIAIFEYGGISSGLSKKYFFEKLNIIYKNNKNLNKVYNLFKFLKMCIPINRKVIGEFCLKITK